MLIAAPGPGVPRSTRGITVLRPILIAFLVLSAPACTEADVGKEGRQGKPGITGQLEPAQKLLAAEQYDEAYAEYLRFAEKGNPLAQFTVGMFHRVGWGRPVDEAKACDWFEKAAEKDIPVALHYVGEAYLRGEHREPDPQRAADLFVRAGELGHYLSYRTLGEMMLDGRGVPKDAAKGLELLRRAADHGVPTALVPTGKLLLSGEAGPPDPAAARAYFERAAQREDPEAEYHLGILARDGLGGVAVHEMAHHWLERSAAHGYLPAYLACAEEFLAPHHGARPSETHLAKAYLWASAASRRLDEGDEKARAGKVLERVLEIMPASWRADLDEKVEEHLRTIVKTDS